MFFSKISNWDILSLDLVSVSNGFDSNLEAGTQCILPFIHYHLQSAQVRRHSWAKVRLKICKIIKFCPDNNISVSLIKLEKFEWLTKSCTHKTLFCLPFWQIIFENTATQFSHRARQLGKMMFDRSFGSRTHRCYRVSGMTLYPWILLHATLVVLGQQCFEDAVAAGQRRNLSDTESGESFPFAMWVPTWASGTLTSAVVGILVEAWVPGQTKFVVGLLIRGKSGV